MARRGATSAWARAMERSFVQMTRGALKATQRATAVGLKLHAAQRKPPPGQGDWLAGMAIGPAGARRYRLFRPPGVPLGERLPMMVMLHGCGQDARSFAESTRMNRIAARERFVVLYPEQDRLANAQGCWNWFDTRSGRAHGEADLIMRAIDQACLLYGVDRTRIAVAGLSAGASMAALLATCHPGRFRAVMMHSGIPPGTAHSTLSAVGAMHGLRPSRPLPVMPIAMAALWPPLLVVHGGVDRVVSARNGQAAARVWAQASGARTAGERRVQRGNRYPMTVTDFKLRGATLATLVEVEGLGHAWSGGAARKPYSDGAGPDASRMMWAFAAKHFRG
ncbi:MAG TPA: PHB depolymerase family esterase [Ramlibacter sp.]|nr:PHB depolymerase family esterase [Ramlibacter sp.]